jgi:hypothetical protein
MNFLMLRVGIWLGLKPFASTLYTILPPFKSARENQLHITHVARPRVRTLSQRKVENTLKLAVFL